MTHENRAGGRMVRNLGCIKPEVLYVAAFDAFIPSLNLPQSNPRPFSLQIGLRPLFSTPLMMMSFICSCRNRKKPYAIYPYGYSPPRNKEAYVMMLPP
jgi:hypothetical protein